MVYNSRATWPPEAVEERTVVSRKTTLVGREFRRTRTGSHGQQAVTTQLEISSKSAAFSISEAF